MNLFMLGSDMEAVYHGVSMGRGGSRYIWGVVLDGGHETSSRAGAMAAAKTIGTPHIQPPP